MYENRWAAPFAQALRRGGARLVAAGRIPVQDVIAALDSAEAAAAGDLTVNSVQITGGSTCQASFAASPAQLS